MRRLEGRHAIVTGGGTGIGAAIARSLAAEGAKLTLIGRRLEKLEEVAGGKMMPIAADVTDALQTADAFEQAHSANGQISILINNAGAVESGRFEKVTDDGWRRIMAVNLDALLYCTQAALPDLLDADHGRIVNIASVAGLKGYAYTAPYVAAKHGAVGLTRALAVEYAKTRLTVNAVCPGFTETDIVADAVAKIVAKTGRSEEDARAELARFNPQGRMVTPEEVASAVLWLCLPENGSVTGQTLTVAGGEVM
jgi:NAD(P)-dependent dehydrogenase (short-subunit alcohol dehydrogenase family)